jgi:methylated-DNA-[protein]-cysteine S-methyltransferase
MTFACTSLDTPIGRMLAASDGRALTGLWFEHQRHFPAAAAAWARRDDLPLFGALRAVLAAYFADDMPDDALVRVPLAPSGTSFQQRVWEALRAIPYGATCAYVELARRVEVPQAARAVGAAVGRNPISILIPCHRVVGSDGTLTGYAGGLDRKRALLALEHRTRVRSGPRVADERNNRADTESGPVAAPR